MKLPSPHLRSPFSRGAAPVSPGARPRFLPALCAGFSRAPGPVSPGGATRRRGGFTLLEMLVVIVIIAMLAALMFRMVGVIGRSNDEAATRAIIERVANALEEFKAIYGKYPPVQPYAGSQRISYEYPGRKTWGETEKDAEAKANSVIKAKRGRMSTWGEIVKIKGHDYTCAIFTFGLTSFFVPRYNGTAEYGPKRFVGIENGRLKRDEDEGFGAPQWTLFNSRADNRVGDTDRDLNAVRRMLPFLGGKLGDDNRIAANGVLVKTWSERGDPLGKRTITNSYYTIWDAWRHDLHYVSHPPYETYKIWSAGPDGLTIGDTRPGGSKIKAGDPETTDDIVSGHF